MAFFFSERHGQCQGWKHEVAAELDRYNTEVERDNAEKEELEGKVGVLSQKIAELSAWINNTLKSKDELNKKSLVRISVVIGYSDHSVTFPFFV